MNHEPFMQEALHAARRVNFKEGLPIGAALVINGKLVGVKANSNKVGQTWAHHAETQLLHERSAALKAAKKENKDAEITLYSTLEPCLMCLGTAILHRVDTIVYASRDLLGGACELHNHSLSPWYQERWPRMIKGVLKQEAAPLMVNYIEAHPEEGWAEELLEDLKRQTTQ